MTTLSDPGLPHRRRPGFKLYSEGGIVLGAFLGSVFAGAILLSRNHSRLSRSDAARDTIVLGLVALGAVFLAIFMEPQSVAVSEFVYQAAQAGVVYLYAKRTQGTLLTEHEQLGGEFYSKWRAAGIALVVGAIIGVIVFALSLPFSSSWSSSSRIQYRIQ